MESSFDSQPNSTEKENGDLFSKSFQDIISTLLKGNSWGFPDHLLQYHGFWHSSVFLQGILSAQQQFQAQPADIILCSAPKTGTTWLKSLTYATITRTSYNDSTSPLLSKMPHDVVPFMELDHAHFSTHRHLGIPVLATHMPYSALPKPVTDSGCKIVYICRDPKDSFVSLYLFLSKYQKSQNMQTFNLEEAFEQFCQGVCWYGPYWDHVLEFWTASLEHPDKILFLKYEEMRDDTILYVQRLAEFIGCPFSSEEEEKGVPEKIVKMCSFENLSNLEVNKNGKHRVGGAENANYFLKGKVGDWENWLTPEMAARLDQITMQKLSGSGLTL